MKLLNLYSLLALGQCGLFDSIEEILSGKLDAVLGGETDAAELLQSLSAEHKDVLGGVPAGVQSMWQTVVDEVPNGAKRLMDEIRKEVHDKHHKAKGKHHKEHHMDKPHAKHQGSTHDFEIKVTDERFPEHALRATDPGALGVDDTKQYSGYLDVEDADKHFFYWFFESRNDPKNDPVVLWLNGGPGCSSLTGLFFELGPASIGADLKPKHNKWSWNNNANVIFLDQPVNVGYSYGSDAVSDTVSAGKDVYAFLELFFKQFPEYADREFHIAGESYAGHYIPVFASEVLSHDDRSFNLTSVLIGNGLTDPLRQYDLYEPMACGDGGAPAVVDADGCQGMLESQDRCDAFIESCYESQSAWSCVPAAIYCNNAQMGPYQKTGRNVYDVREDCQGGGLCYPQLSTIEEYLNQDEVKLAVGATGVEHYQGCNMDINTNFLFKGDWMKPYYTAVSELLEKEVPVLIYAGDKDFICNWLGNEAWSRELEWSGHEEFASLELSPWTLAHGKNKGKEVGQVRNHNHFTFLRVYEAGHMVPFNQPEASLEMLDRWLKGDFTFA